LGLALGIPKTGVIYSGFWTGMIEQINEFRTLGFLTVDQ
jgi:hypothetical protein